MKKTMIVSALIALVLVVLTAPVAAQGQYTISRASITNSLIASNATTTVNLVNAFTRWEEVAVTAKAYSDAGTDTVTFTWSLSADGTNYANVAANKKTLVFPLATTGAICTTNITLGSAGYLRLDSITVGDTNSQITNCSVFYSVKPQRNGK